MAMPTPSSMSTKTVTSIQTCDLSCFLTGTVLCVNKYPTEEIVVLLHGSPAVIALRNVKLCSSNTGEVQCSSDIFTLREGVGLVIMEVGNWNVHTAAMHGGRIMQSGGNDIDSTSPGSTKETIKSVTVLPTRRKRMSMQ